MKTGLFIALLGFDTAPSSSPRFRFEPVAGLAVLALPASLLVILELAGFGLISSCLEAFDLVVLVLTATDRVSRGIAECKKYEMYVSWQCFSWVYMGQLEEKEMDTENLSREKPSFYTIRFVHHFQMRNGVRIPLWNYV